MRIYWRDTYNFVSKLTLERIFNVFCLLCSYFLTKWLAKPIQWGIPMTISIEPTTACNLKCPECPSGLRSFTRDTGNLKMPLFNNIIDQLHKKVIYLIFYFQGEPFINPDFLEMVSMAAKKNIYTITSTNGHFLNMANARKTILSGLDRIIISVDGATQEVYESYRKEGKLDVVLQGAKNLVAAKKEAKSKTPHIIFQFLVVRPNQHQIPEIFELAKNIGVDEVKLKTTQIYDYKNGNDLIPTIDKYSRYFQNHQHQWQVKNSLQNHCWKLWHACVFTWDGIVVPCCFDKDAAHRLGNLNETSFVDIWRGRKYHTFRKSLLKGRQNIDICTNCTEGCTVWA